MSTNYTDFIKGKERKREDKDNIFCTGITDREFVYFAIGYLLGHDWYIVDPLTHEQINQIALEEILNKYCKEYRKEVQMNQKLINIIAEIRRLLD